MEAPSVGFFELLSDLVFISHTHSLCASFMCLRSPSKSYSFTSSLCLYLCLFVQVGEEVGNDKDSPPTASPTKGPPPSRAPLPGEAEQRAAACPACLATLRKPASCPQSDLIFCLTSLSCMSINVSVQMFKSSSC